MLCDVLIRVFCGISVEDKCRQQLHPLNEVKNAKEIVDLNKSIDCYSNSSDFVSTVKYYGLEKGVKTEFYIDGKSCDDDIEPVFENFNKSLFETLKNIENESDRTLFSLNIKSDLGYNKVRLPFEKPIEQEIEERIAFEKEKYKDFPNKDEILTNIIRFLYQLLFCIPL